MNSLRVALMLVLALTSCTLRPAQQQPKEGTVNWYVWDAHRKGVTEARIDHGQIQRTGNFRLDWALKHNTLLLVEPLGEAVTHDERDIVTFRKYRIVEQLTVQDSTIDVPFPDVVPASLLPLGPAEFVMPNLGGTLVIDGIKLEENDLSDNPLRPPPHKRQLMFVRFICQGYALLNYDDRGLFWVDDDNQTIHAMVSDTPLATDIRTRSANNLDHLRSISKTLANKSGDTPGATFAVKMPQHHP